MSNKGMFISMLCTFISTSGFAQVHRAEIVNSGYDKVVSAKDPDALVSLDDLRASVPGMIVEVQANSWKKTAQKNVATECTLMTRNRKTGEEGVYLHAWGPAAEFLCKNEPADSSRDINVYAKDITYRSAGPALVAIDELDRNQMSCVRRGLNSLGAVLQKPALREFLREIHVDHVKVSLMDNSLRARNDRELFYGVSIHDDPTLEVDLLRDEYGFCYADTSAELYAVLNSWRSAYKKRLQELSNRAKQNEIDTGYVEARQAITGILSALTPHVRVGGR